MRGTWLKAIVTLVACIGGTAVAHPVLTFTEHVETRPHKNSSVKGGSEESTIHVTLGRNYVVTERKGTRSILDFEKRRIYQVSLAQKTFSESSLYAVLGFHAMELQNRVRLNAVLNAAKVESSSNTPALAEHLFSLRAAGQDTAIDSSRSGGTTAYRWQGTELLTVSDSARQLPAKGDQAQYWRWLRYTAGGHPAIYASLGSREGVPEKLTVLRPDAAADKLMTLTLASMTNEADAPYSLAGFTRADAPREPYLTLLKLDAAAADDEQREAAILHERDEATAKGRFLDAAWRTSRIKSRREARTPCGSLRFGSASLRIRMPDRSSHQSGQQMRSRREEVSRRSGPCAARPRLLMRTCSTCSPRTISTD